MSYRGQRRYSTSSESSSSSGYSCASSARSGSRSSGWRTPQSSHSRNTARTEVWRCRECLRVFGTKQGLNCHITTVHERPRSSKSRETDLDFRQLAIRDGDRYPCRYCDKDYATQGNLNRHVREIHGHGAGNTVRKQTNIQNNINIQNNYFYIRK